jgi:RHS repeat-associated protein
MIYPSGRVLTYNYAGSVASAISRLTSLSDSTGTLESYTYLGDGTLIQVTHPQVGGGAGLTLSYGSDGDYSGLDNFGRVVNQDWTVDGTLVDGYGYTYDADSNVLTKTNQAYAASGASNTAAYDEGYQYDDLGRLTNATRGGVNLENWTLDALGNTSSFTVGATATQTETSDSANQVTGISGGWVTPTYDANGNQISGSTPGNETVAQFYVYDAWNRLVAVKAPSTNDSSVAGATIATYQYDGRGFRIQKTVISGANAGTYDYYLSSQNQVLEVRENGNSHPAEQYVWSPQYVDDAVMVYTDAAQNGLSITPIYFTHDANYNVTALVDGATGAVLNRFVYTPDGTQTALSASWGAATVTSSLSVTGGPGIQGLFRDAETGLIYDRARYTNPSLGTFLTPEPSGGTPYVDGMNLYLDRAANPINSTDPDGLKVTWIDAGMSNTETKDVDLDISNYNKLVDDALAYMSKVTDQQMKKVTLKFADQTIESKEKFIELLKREKESKHVIVNSTSKIADFANIVWNAAMNGDQYPWDQVVVGIHGTAVKDATTGKVTPTGQVRLNANRYNQDQTLKYLKGVLPLSHATLTVISCYGNKDKVQEELDMHEVKKVGYKVNQDIWEITFTPLHMDRMLLEPGGPVKGDDVPPNPPK